MRTDVIDFHPWGDGLVGASQHAKAVVVIPTFRERANLAQLIEGIRSASPDLHVLIVDDRSGDETPDFIGNRNGFGEWLFLIEHPSKGGIARAYRSGFEWSLGRGYPFILQMDADLSHDPADLPRLLGEGEAGTGLVLGSRYIGGIRILNWTMKRLLLSLGASLYVRLLLFMPFYDPTGGFRCWRSELLRHVLKRPMFSRGYAFQIEMLFRAWRVGATIQEVPIIFGQRQNGDSKMSRIIALEAAWRVVVLACEGAFAKIRAAIFCVQ